MARSSKKFAINTQLAVLALIGLLVYCYAAPGSAIGSSEVSTITKALKALEDGRAATGIKLLRRIPAKSDYGPVAGIIMAKSYMKLGCPEIAEAYLKKVLDDKSAGVYKDLALELLIDALCAQQDTDALDIIEKMVRKAPGGKKPELIFKAAELHEDTRNYESAEKLYRKLYFEFPASVEGLRAAERLADLVVKKKIPPPNYSDQLRLKRAARLFRRGRFEKAAIMYRIYLKANPRALDVKLKLARCMFKARKNDETIRICKKILQEDKANKYRTKTLHLLSLVFWRLDQDNRFLTCCHTILKEGDASYKKRTLYNLAAFHMERGRYSKAEDLLIKLLRLDPGPSFEVDVLWKLAWAKYLSKDYSSSAKTFSQVGLKSKSRGLKEAALYWEARSRQKSSGFKSAKSDFIRLARENPLDYYGIQASRILKDHGVFVSLENRSGTEFPDIELSRKHLEDEHIQRALKLIDAGLYEYALMNLEDLPGSVKKDEPVAFLMASTAYNAKRYHQARSTLYSAFGKYVTNPPLDAPAKFIELAFPCVHEDQTIKMARKHAVDPFLIWAVMRQESLYNSEAISPAGAMGLMQVMPRTAKMRSDKKIKTCDLTALLLDPQSNIRVGTGILADKLKSFGNAIVPALASYNADIRKVRQWHEKRGSMDVDEFIETIPYQETRLYVKKVLEGYRAYSYLHKRKNLAGLW